MPTLIHPKPVDQIDLDTLPRRVDRREAASILTRNFFPISHRTLEAAPLTWRRINGRALVETPELVAWASAKVAAAAPIRGGRRG
jgi:hypothetical protein